MGKIVIGSNRTRGRLADLGALTAVQILDNAILALSPLVFLKLNDTSGTTAVDSSGNGRNGTYSGTYTLGGWTGGDGRNYATFNGGRVSIPDDNVFSANTASGITIMAWVKPDAAMPTTNARFIISKGGNGGGNYEWDLAWHSGSNSRLRFNFYSSGGSNMSNEFFDVSLSTSTGDLVAIKSAAPVFNQRFGMYAESDSVVASSQAATSNVSYSNGTSDVQIGYRQDSPASFNWIGGIAMVAIFAGNVSLDGFKTLAVNSGLA